MDSRSILLIEPFYCGSHRQLIDLLHSDFPDSALFSLPGKKWHWKARTSALYFSQAIPLSNSYRVLFASSVLNLAELVALRPDLGRLWKVLYFHENQLIYPVRKHQDRDFQYGYNQILSCMVADKVVFNSRYNMESFLSSINTFLKLIPDHRPKGIPEMIRPKCCIIHFPLVYPTTAKDSIPACSERETNLKSTRVSEKDESNKSLVDRADGIYVDSAEVSQSLTVPDRDRFSNENWTINKQRKSENLKHRHKSNFSDEIDNITCTCLRRNMGVVTNDDELKSTGICKFSKDHRCKLANSDFVQNTNEPNLQDIGCSSKKQLNIETNMASTESKHDEDMKNVNDNSKCQLTLTCTGTKEDCKALTAFEYTNTECKNDISDTRVSDSECTEGYLDRSQREERHEMQIKDGEKPLHIVWPHRWEHDKEPENFFSVMFQLDKLGLNFHLSVLGEQFSDTPDIFVEAKGRLVNKILNWGYQETKDEYFEVLKQADCVVSTARHEFFGVAMLEAVYCGCYPLCPNRLVYPEIFPAEYIYNTDNQLFKKLREFCRRPSLCRKHKLQVDVQQFSWDTLKMDFKNLLTQDYRN